MFRQKVELAIGAAATKFGFRFEFVVTPSLHYPDGRTKFGSLESDNVLKRA